MLLNRHKKNWSKFLTLVVLSLSLTTTSSPSSSAIFGLSKCEKLKKSLNSEEAIGFENWKSFDSARDSMFSNESYTWSQLSNVLKKWKIVILSDLSIYKAIENNNNCFTIKFAAKNRENLDSTQSELNMVSKAIQDISKLSVKVRDSFVPRSVSGEMKKAYPTFHNWQTGKKLS